MVEEPCVLFRDYNGFFAPLATLYWSTTSAVLVARHSFSNIEEILSIYCPQCLNRFMDDDVRTFQSRCPTCLECPMCCRILNRVTTSQGNSVHCPCGWTGSVADTDFHYGITEIQSDNSMSGTGTSGSDLATVHFNNITKSFHHDTSCGSNIAIHRSKCLSRYDIVRPWRLPDLGLALAAKTHRMYPIGSFRRRRNDAAKSNDRLGKVSTISCAVDQLLKCPSLQPGVIVSNLQPGRVQFRSKCTVRCRKDVEDCKMSILVQPKRNPLDGDSFSTTRGKTSFFVKDSSAVQELPNVIINRVPTHGALCTGGFDTLLLTISNPKPEPVRIHLMNDPSYCSPLQHGAFDVHRTQRLKLADGGPSSIDFTLTGYEDELLRDEDDNISPAKCCGDLCDSGSMYSLMLNHNSVLLRCSVCTVEPAGCTADALRTTYVLPLVLNITDVNIPSLIPKRYEIIIAFPSQ